MASTAMPKLLRALSRPLPSTLRTTARRQLPQITHSTTLISRTTVLSTAHRGFTTSSSYCKGLSPDSTDPQPKDSQSHDHGAKPAELAVEAYHDVANIYLGNLLERLEEVVETREDVDVEYSDGVMNLHFPPLGKYVINKQPANKQIWLASPISGPKRFDYVVTSEGQNAKEGTGKGEWVYSRDGTTLSGLLRSELGVDVEPEVMPEDV